jgi:hypothetical protein
VMLRREEDVFRPYFNGCDPYQVAVKDIHP